MLNNFNYLKVNIVYKVFFILKKTLYLFMVPLGIEFYLFIVLGTDNRILGSKKKNWKLKVILPQKYIILKFLISNLFNDSSINVHHAS